MKVKPARLLRIAALCAVLLPFLLTSMIASGVMPARATNGAIMLVICTADGPLEMLVDPATMQPTAPGHDMPSQKDKHDSSCAWAANHADFAAPGFAAPIQPLRHAMALPTPARPTILAAAHATGLPPSTGPPQSG